MLSNREWAHSGVMGSEGVTIGATLCTFEKQSRVHRTFIDVRSSTVRE
jgi:hypothetical protein